jgi:hypothetical protein
MGCETFDRRKTYENSVSIPIKKRMGSETRAECNRLVPKFQFLSKTTGCETRDKEKKVMKGTVSISIKRKKKSTKLKLISFNSHRKTTGYETYRFILNTKYSKLHNTHKN